MRLLVVSNRLPITVVKQGGKLAFQESVGGLVSGLSAYLDSLKSSSFIESDYLWVGWPGTAVDGKAKAEVRKTIRRDFHSHPVFLSERSMDRFYYGFCNKTIWPLFHYFPAYTAYDSDFWHHYKQVNETFRDAVLEVLQPDDVVWIHDYHLMLLPQLLRERVPEARIGYFHHIPFPSFEVFRLLPGEWRSEILKGLLGANLVGFHTHDYTQYFLRCVARILGYEPNLSRIAIGNRIVRADTFPMGIQYQRFADAAVSQGAEAELAALKTTLAGLKVVLSIDRLDYSKGIINRLRGYEAFLEQNPDWRGRVALALVVVPSRVGVDDYQRTKRQIDEMVGKINGTFGTIGWTPILYQYRFLPLQPLVALYSMAHVALVTPLRDGMNLIAKEYVAARTDRTGVLVLSEMAGAAKELGEALIINPNDVQEIARALLEALEMPAEEQVRRNTIMQSRISRYDVVRWADDFIQRLLHIREEETRLEAKSIGPRRLVQLRTDFMKARKRLLLLDYDGTLVGFADRPEAAIPPETVLRVLGQLAGDARNHVVLVSGRDRATMEKWFGHLPIGLVAEYGAWVKEADEEWRMVFPLSSEWKSEVLPLLRMQADRLPGSFIEEKEFSVVWHHRGSDPEMSAARANEVLDELVSFTANIEVQVLHGSKVIEVRNTGVNKGAACLHWIFPNAFDFGMAIGDDVTDEDLFRVLPETAYSIKVGTGTSCARFRLPDPSAVLRLLEALVTTTGETELATTV